MFHALAAKELQPYLYRYEDESAVRHALRVACGLDSLVLGEPQIYSNMPSPWLSRSVPIRPSAPARCPSPLLP